MGIEPTNRHRSGRECETTEELLARLRWVKASKKESSGRISASPTPTPSTPPTSERENFIDFFHQIEGAEPKNSDNGSNGSHHGSNGSTNGSNGSTKSTRSNIMSSSAERRAFDIFHMPIRNSQDLSMIRTQVQKLATKIGFGLGDATKIVTAVGEIVRNVTLYAEGFEAEIIAHQNTKGIKIEVWDKGPGIPVETAAEIENGTYKSKTGMGRGISASKELMDSFFITTIGGTRVIMEKYL